MLRLFLLSLRLSPLPEWPRLSFRSIAPPPAWSIASVFVAASQLEIHKTPGLSVQRYSATVRDWSSRPWNRFVVFIRWECVAFSSVKACCCELLHTSPWAQSRVIPQYCTVSIIRYLWLHTWANNNIDKKNKKKDTPVLLHGNEAGWVMITKQDIRDKVSVYKTMKK